MKKIVALLLALIMVFSLVACGAKEEAPAAAPAETPAEKPAETPAKEEAPAAEEKDVVLSVMYNASDSVEFHDAFESALKDFCAKEGIGYDWIEIGTGDDSTQQLEARKAAGQMPDVFQVGNGVASEALVDEGWLADLSDLGAAANEFSSMRDAFTYNDVLYGIPNGIATCFVYYNKTLWAEAGLTEADIPKTYEQWNAVCDKIQAAGITPMAIAFSNPGNTTFSFAFAQYVVAKNPDWLKQMKEGTFDFTAPEVVKVFEVMEDQKGYYQDGAISAEYAVGNQVFSSGQAAMIFMGSWGTAEFVNPEVNGFETGVFLAPFNAEGEPIAGAVSPETGLAANAKSENVEYAKKFIDYLYYEDYARIQNSRGNIPHIMNAQGTVLPDVIQTAYDELSASPIMGQLYFCFLPSTIGEDTITKLWQGIMLGELTPADAAAQMQEFYNQAF